MTSDVSSICVRCLEFCRCQGSETDDCSRFQSSPEDGGSVFLWKAGSQLQIHTDFTTRKTNIDRSYTHRYGLTDLSDSLCCGSAIRNLIENHSLSVVFKMKCADKRTDIK